jgi:hypothetical protein
MKPIIFLSYSRVDIESIAPISDLLDELRRDDKVELFHDGEIRAGELWDPEIERHLRRATHFLLAISDDYIKSDYIGTRELPVIRSRAETRSAAVFPLLIKGQNWPMFLDSDRAAFLNKIQYWPAAGNHPVLMSDLSFDDRTRQLKKLRRQLLDEKEDPIDGNHSWSKEKDAVRARLAGLKLPDAIDMRIMSVQLPSYLGANIAYGATADLANDANEILYDIDEASFPKRRIPPPPLDLAGKEEAYWAGVLLDLSQRSPLSIVTLLELVQDQAPGVKPSLEHILNAGEPGADS